MKDETSSAARFAGWAHARCLVEASVAETWTEWHVGIRAQLAGTRTLVAAPRLVLLLHEATGDRIVLTDGVEVRLSAKRALAATRGPDVRLRVPLEHELNLDLRAPEHSGVRHELAAALGPPGGSIPIARLVEAFGVADRLVTPEALEGGVVRALADEPGVTARELASGALCATASYALHLPSDAAPGFPGLDR